MAKLPARPKSKRGIAFAIGGSVLIVAVAAFVVVYFVIFPTSSPKRFSLSGSTPGTSTPGTSTAGASTAGASTGSTSTAATTPTGASTPSVSSSRLAGGWKIVGGSQAGYRVREKLAFLPAQSDAVGRTSSITGGATFTEAKDTVTVKAASFTVAVNTLKSDRSLRDEKIRVIGLESNTYPTATFVLSAPLKLAAGELVGHVVHTSVTGTFKIHGTSRLETVPLEMSLSGSTIEAVGTLTFPWSEFDMQAPSVAGFVSVTNKATMEFELRLQRS